MAPTRFDVSREGGLIQLIRQQWGHVPFLKKREAHVSVGKKKEKIQKQVPACCDSLVSYLAQDSASVMISGSSSSVREELGGSCSSVRVNNPVCVSV